MSKLPINKFLEYFSKPLTLDELQLLNKTNNVEFEFLELYTDFIISLITLVDMSYLGDELINSKDTQVNHFNWCWIKTIENFQKENIRFNLEGNHKVYFFNYLRDVYYDNYNRDDNTIKHMTSFWKQVMNMKNVKTKSEYDLFTEVYDILKKNLSNYNRVDK